MPLRMDLGWQSGNGERCSVNNIQKVGLVGYGYWGEKLGRTLDSLGVLKAYCDIKPGIIVASSKSFYGDYSDMLRSENLDGIVISTPPETHYGVAMEALNEGKHIFVEKPMTTDYVQAVELENLALLMGVGLKVGHIYLHNPGIKLMPIPVGGARLYVKLLNVGGPPSESTRDLLWAGLPHACSLALHFFPDWPHHIVVFERNEKRIKVRLDYWNGSTAWLDVGDHTGVRTRSVELRVGNTRYYFSADEPNFLIALSGVDRKQDHVQINDDPLTLEMRDFLQGVGVDTMGSKVVKLIEEIRDAGKD